METLKQILPQFKYVKILSDRDGCKQIRKAEKSLKSAWLLNEEKSIWQFIERLGAEDENSDSLTPFNFFDFHIAYNVKFPEKAVILMKNAKILRSGLKDLSELLNALLQAGKGEFSVVIKSSANSSELKLKILQQFIYLRICLPIKIVDVEKSVQISACDVGIFGTKKAGKSALINALLGEEYAVSSTILPTPNKVIYCAAPKKSVTIFLTYKDVTQAFRSTIALQKFLSEENSRANKNSSTLEEMTIRIPNFPNFLDGARLIDTPGSNFAVAQQHAKVTEKILTQVTHAIFVMNYSAHLTQDEIKLFDRVYRQFNSVEVQKPILVAINRVDEIFTSPEVKSYERVADYIHCRLTALGYKNFLVVSVSALQSVNFDNITKIISPPPRNFYERMKNFFIPIFNKPISLEEQIKTLKDTCRGTDRATRLIFVKKILSDYEDFYGIKIADVRDLQRINRINYLKCLIYNRW